MESRESRGHLAQSTEESSRASLVQVRALRTAQGLPRSLRTWLIWTSRIAIRAERGATKVDCVWGVSISLANGRSCRMRIGAEIRRQVGFLGEQGNLRRETRHPSSLVPTRGD